ncbi:MAG: ABC-2 transporter permease, partial [Ruminiclostridium sp.]|nr:ABC-2 transporter permease [Ruminiclostridium sp.]
MKGLILKDIYNVRIQILLGMVLLVLMYVLIWLSKFYNKEALGLIGVLDYSLINYLTITVCSTFLLNTLSDDIKSGWAKMQLTMPVSDKEIIGGKLIAAGITVIALMLFSLLCNILGIVFYDLPLEPMIMMPVIMALLQMAVLSAVTVIGYRLQGQVMAVYIAVMLIVAGGAAAPVIGFLNYNISVSVLRLIYYA